jgi:hypothetical protein
MINVIKSTAEIEERNEITGERRTGKVKERNKKNV